MNKPFNKIFFDFDSTLIQGESLDMLAKLRNKASKVLEMTRMSMNGEVPLEAVLKKKMDMIKPRQSDVNKLIAQCENRFVEDAKEVISALNFLNKHLFIVSSNFNCVVRPLGGVLGIPQANIFANDLLFDEKGEYVGISDSSPLAFSSGKAEFIKGFINPGDRTVFVGDSITDLVCQDVVDLFVGFGGVEERSAVKKEASVYFAVPTLAPFLAMVCQPHELTQLKQNGFSNLVIKANGFLTTTTGPGS